MARVLIIDDDEAMRLVLRIALEQVGYQVAESVKGQQAFDEHRKNPADVIIMDLRLPNEDGLDIITRFLRSYPQSRIIAVSGSVIKERLLHDAKRLGAVGSLRKPFEPQEILELITDVLRFA